MAAVATSSARRIVLPAHMKRRGRALERIMAVAAGVMLAITLWALWRGRALWGGLDLQTSVHLLTLVPALILTPFLLWGTKGATLHRWMGWTWCALMLATAASAYFIRDINGGSVSWIHIFVLITAVSVPRLIVQARRHRVEHHRGVALGLSFGGLIVAGIGSYLGNRHLAFWFHS